MGRPLIGWKRSATNTTATDPAARAGRRGEAPVAYSASATCVNKKDGLRRLLNPTPPISGDKITRSMMNYLRKSA
jgi:hypothetical protein